MEANTSLTEAYLQIEVDEESKKFLVINTPQGLFQYNRLPFGVKCAPAIFQQIMDSMISGIEGTAAYLDDLIITGSTVSEHRGRLNKVFQRIQEYGFKVNLDKCSFLKSEVNYLGFIITAEGRRPDPMKVEVIKNMPPPKNVSELRSLLGMINYYAAFVPDMRNLRGPLDKLLLKDSEFHWTTEHQKCLDTAKNILQSGLLLTYYDPKLPIIVAADASQYGIGAVIYHKLPDGTEKAIYHASRTLTSAEKNYAQIEKEALALVFACTKFHKYIQGRKFTLLTDHRPLLTIFGSEKKSSSIYSISIAAMGYHFTWI